MRPNAVYSKSGRESRSFRQDEPSEARAPRGARCDRCRATLADVAQKSGNEYDADFQRLIVQLDKDGFIREVSSGAGPVPPRDHQPAGSPIRPSIWISAARLVAAG